MTLFQTEFEEIRKLIEYEDFNRLIKRIIDLTLDTENIIFYRKTTSLLDWLDSPIKDMNEKKERFLSILNDLYIELSERPVILSENDLLLSVYNLIKSYKNSSFALGPINMEIEKGKIVGLVGENGNGKTTLLRSLCGELKPTNGKINYLFPYKNDFDLRSKLIYIPQRTPSWQGSLLSNLRFTAASYGITGEENILTVELIIARMGLRKYRNYKWKNLSSGYKMRFELARALLRKPQLLLIDEPLANLDILAQQIVLDDFRDIARSPFRPLGIILSSQQLYEVEKTSDAVIFLKEGQPRNITHDTDVTDIEISQFIVEFESEWNKEQLNNAFNQLGMEKLQINGGTYVASFPYKVDQNSFLKIILEHEIPITYYRNISNSTRRFFLS
ncbi:ABC transporter ATP-binding protein [Dysgonomonas sp. Marseille-P4677]|uniref:ABC transporter ATP-binding protein n=1 Tax=Dysgonomonas sp. Marseille-P4677 TaxID=2364790 RepID=UPI001914160F|nr:ABC transporter ATP-binding protein [Dysgonomonas sp. Marseille-P4677]MBK5721799.1 ABC transporter ATP-binding protein [Dysgonomonas sp. Marseille-P4677]